MQLVKENSAARQPMRCDYCGQFISYDALQEGYAVRRMVYPDSQFTCDEYETACEKHR